MAELPPQIGENTKVILDLKTIGLIVSFIIGLATTYFTLRSDIALAMEMPKPEISKIEFDMKDELIRQTIMDTQDDVEMILEKLDKLDERIYEIQKGN